MKNKKIKFGIAFVVLIVTFAIVNATPSFVSPSSNAVLNATEDIYFEYDFVVNDDAANYPITFNDTSADVGFSCFSKTKISSNTLRVNFTPDNACVGYYHFVMNAWNTLSELTGIFINFNISNANDPPYIVSADPSTPIVNVLENGVVEFNVHASDDDLNYSDTLNYFWYVDFNASSKITSTKANETYSNASYSPSIIDFDAGYHNVSVLVNDSAGEYVMYNWTVYVTNVNRNPVFNGTIQNITFAEDHNLSKNISLMDYFYDLDVLYNNDTDSWRDLDTGKDLTFSYEVINGTDSINMIFGTNGSVSLEPDKDWFGSIIVRFIVDDTQLGVAYSNNVNLTVTPVNDAPVLAPIPDNLTYLFSEFTYLTDATDVENDTFTFSISSPTLADVHIDSNGLINITSNATPVGNHTIFVSVDDGMNSSSRNFTFEIRNNALPSIDYFTDQSVLQNSDFSILINGTDADGDKVWISVNDSIFNLSRYNDTAYYLNASPTQQSLVGNHSIKLSIRDIHNAYNFSVFNFEIIDVPEDPIIVPDNITNDQLKLNTPFSMLIYASDADGDITGFSDNTSLFNIVTVTTGSTSNPAVANISFTPASTGYHHINISVADSRGVIDSFDLKINITINHAPYFTLAPNITCDEGQDCNVSYQATDPDWQDIPSLNYSDNTSLFNITGLGEDAYINFLKEDPTYEYAVLTVTDGVLNSSITVVVNVTVIDDTPEFVENVSNMSVWDNIVENISVHFNITCYDEENDTLFYDVTFLNFTDLNGSVYTSGIDLFNLSAPRYIPGNRSYVIIDFTPLASQVGHYWINISVNDNNTEASTVFNFTVRNVNNAPKVNWSLTYLNQSLFIVNSDTTFYELNTSYENTTFTITSVASDADFDSVTYNWTVENGGKTTYLTSHSSSLTYTIPFDAYPSETLNMIVNDGHGGTTKISWQINATNVNREGYFGWRIYSINSTSSGTFTDMEYSGDHLRLSASGANYVTHGQFQTNDMDFDSSDLLMPTIDFRDLEIYNDDTHSGYNITAYTATYQSLPFPYYSWRKVEYNASLGKSIVSDGHQYLAILLDVNSSDNTITPLIDGIKIKYRISDMEVEVNSDPTPWLFLDNFFFDPDTDDTLSYGVQMLTGSDFMNISVDSYGGVKIALFYPGTASLRFNMSDGEYTIWSNVINISITSKSNEGSGDSGGSGGGGSSGGSNVQIERKYKDRYVKEPIALDIIHPENVTFYSNETLVVPIQLKNNEEFDLLGLTITSSVDRDGLDLSLSDDYFDKLLAGETKDFYVTINVSKIYESYGVYINVNVSEPEYFDTAKIMINSLKSANEEYDKEMMKLSFVNDLLVRNQECSELSEYIDRAKNYIANGEYDQGSKLLDQFIHDCKILLKDSSKVNDESPSDFTSMIIKDVLKNKKNLGIAISIAIALALTIILSIVMLYKKI